MDTFHYRVGNAFTHENGDVSVDIHPVGGGTDALMDALHYTAERLGLTTGHAEKDLRHIAAHCNPQYGWPEMETAGPLFTAQVLSNLAHTHVELRFHKDIIDKAMSGANISSVAAGLDDTLSKLHNITLDGPLSRAVEGAKPLPMTATEIKTSAASPSLP